MAQLIFGEQFEVRDMRHKEKFQLDDMYLNGYAKKVGVYGTAVYVSLCRHADRQQICFPSIKKIAEEHNCSEKQIGRAIKKLEELNIIKKLRIGKKLNNRYLLLDKSEWTGSLITTDSQSDHLRTGSPIHSKDTQLRSTHKKELCFQLKDWNERQPSPITNFVPENIVNKYGAAKIEAMIKEWGQENQGFSRFLANLKDL